MSNPRFNKMYSPMDTGFRVTVRPDSSIEWTWSEPPKGVSIGSKWQGPNGCVLGIDDKGFPYLEYPDKHREWRYPSGKWGGEVYPDGSFVSYYESGELLTEFNADGSGRTYYEDGTLQIVKEKNGTIYSFYENGNPRFVKKIGENGQETEFLYFEKGSVYQISYSDGKTSRYDLKVLEIEKDGVTYKFKDRITKKDNGLTGDREVEAIVADGEIIRIDDKKKLSGELAAQREVALREYKLSMDDINLATTVWNDAVVVMNEYKSSGEMVRVVATTAERQPSQPSIPTTTNTDSYTVMREKDRYSRN